MILDSTSSASAHQLLYGDIVGGKDGQKMRSGISWIKKQIKNKKFIVLLIIGIITEIILFAEFKLFSYSVLKIARYMILLAAMFLIAWIDQHERRIPNKILILLLTVRCAGLVAEWIVYPEMGLSLLISVLIGLLLGGGMFLLAHFITRGGVGMGDVKLLGVIGAYTGVGSIMTVVFLTAVAAAVYSIVMLILRKVKLKEEIPFAPFVLVGLVLTMVLGM